MPKVTQIGRNSSPVFFLLPHRAKIIISKIFVLLQTLSCILYSGGFFNLWTYLSHSIIEEQKKQWQKTSLNVLCKNQSRCDHTEFFFQNQNICRSIWKVLWQNAIYIISAGKKIFCHHRPMERAGSQETGFKNDFSVNRLRKLNKLPYLSQFCYLKWWLIVSALYICVLRWLRRSSYHKIRTYIIHSKKH